MIKELYGQRPIDLGEVDLSPTEMMFWLYCPIKLAGECHLTIPPNLQQFLPIIDRVQDDCSFNLWMRSYVYLTAKTLWITADNPGNRPGWHSDGFMTNDLNYIWSDRNGTIFWTPDHTRDFSQDHVASLAEMEAAAEAHPRPRTVYPNRHLLRLDERVIHRTPDVTKPGIRSFVKVSISEHRYNLIGNSVNHLLPTDWEMFDRGLERNDPAAMKDFREESEHES